MVLCILGGSVIKSRFRFSTRDIQNNVEARHLGFLGCGFLVLRHPLISSVR